MAEVERSGGHGGIYAMLVVVVILILGVALYFSGALGDRSRTDELDVDVDIQTPEVPAPNSGN